MSDATARAPTRGLLRATLTLLAGGAFAQALPLLLGPWLTRLYSPDEYGRYQLFATVAINLSVVACARYEFALPLARAEDEAQALRRLCLCILALVGVLAGIGGLGWAWGLGQTWPIWLGPAVAVGGALSLATMLAARRQAFRALAFGRVLQYGGAALGQVGAGLFHWGVAGLVMAPVLAQLATTWLLGRFGAGEPAGSPTAAVELAEGPQPPAAHRPNLHDVELRDVKLRDVARRWREFPLLNTPHAFAGALQDTIAVGLIAAALGPAAAGFWGLALRYLKAPATLVGAAVSQALYPKLAEAGPGATLVGRAAVRRVMAVLMAAAAPLVLGLWLLGPWLFGWLFGEAWAGSGQLARALALYIGLHFVASPLAVVTMAWGAQAWALRLAVWGQIAFVLALALGLKLGGLTGAGWAVSLAMAGYFGWYFWRLANWPVAVQQASSAVVGGETL